MKQDKTLRGFPAEATSELVARRIPFEVYDYSEHCTCTVTLRYESDYEEAFKIGYDGFFKRQAIENSMRKMI